MRFGLCLLLWSLAACGGSDAGKVEELEKRVTQLERRVRAMEGRRGGERARAAQGGRQGGPAARRPGGARGPGKGPPSDGATVANVKATGDASRVVLVGEKRRVRLPGPVPEGTYRVMAGFSDGQPVEAGQIQVRGGHDLTLRCVASSRTCSVQ